MTHPYDNEFAPDNVYGHAVALLERFALEADGIHLDFGCGFGAIAEQVRDRLGLRYIGLDVLEEGLDSLKSRGFEVMFFNLCDPVAGAQALRDWLPPGVPIVSMSLLDTLEHLAEPEKALEMMRAVAASHGCPLVLSVPNVAHRDIAMKLVAGQFEYTESGLLDRTHYQHFTEKSLAMRMSSRGWHQVDGHDVVLEESDQNFPPDHPLLSSGTPINALLRTLRHQADHADTVNQFVRVYLATAKPAARAKPDEAPPFLTVVTRTQGKRLDTLRETLLCLSAQTCQDFEVLVVGHRLNLRQQLAVEAVISDQHEAMRAKIRLVKVDRGERAAPLNCAFEQARGLYVAMLDDDDLVFGHWVETFHDLHEHNPGKLLRATAVSQTWDKVEVDGSATASRSKSGYSADYPETFDLFDHLVENRSPLHSLAFPRSLYRELGFRFDETLTTAEDWDFIIRTAPLAGVACSSEVTCIYRRWENAASSYTEHDQQEWTANYRHTLRKIDAVPLLLPAGYTRRTRELLHELDRLRAGPSQYHVGSIDPSQSRTEADYLEALRWRLHGLLISRSWRYTRPLRDLRALLTGQKRAPDPMIWRYSARDLEYMIQQIESSRSWTMTSRLRNLAAAFR